jgi:anti-sigma B factor antagonist
MAIDPSGFSISMSDRDGRAVVLVRGELDLATAPDLEEVVSERLDAGQDVTVDLRELEFMDSSGLRVLVSAHYRASDDGTRFVLVRPREGGEVAKILSIAGIDQELELVDEP